jgi:hypothetical protein
MVIGPGPAGLKFWKQPADQPSITANAWSIADRSVPITLSNSDKTATSIGGINPGVRSSTAQMNGAVGKYYVEFSYDTATSSAAVGIKSKSSVLTNPTIENCRLSPNGTITLNAATVANLGTSLTAGDVACLAWDSGTKKVFFRKNNGLWNNDAAADPATGTNGIDASSLSNVDYCLYMLASSVAVFTVRTEAAEFIYQAPVGFTSWMAEVVPAIATVGAGVGTGNAMAVTEIMVGSDGTAAGTGDAAAVGEVAPVTTDSVGAAAGVGTAAAEGGIGGVILFGDGVAAGAGTATATGIALAPVVASAAGIGVAAATGVALNPAVGTATGIGPVSATGRATGTGVGTVAGVGTATGAGLATVAGSGAAAANGAAQAVGRSTAAVAGLAVGDGFALALSDPGATTGTADGIGAATAIGVSVATASAVGNAVGAGQAEAVGEVVGEVVQPPAYGGGFVPLPRPRPVEGVGYGLMPELEGEAHGVVIAAGNGAAMLPSLAGEATGAVGAGGLGEAAFTVKSAASGDRGSKGRAAAVLGLDAAGSGTAVVQGKGFGVIGLLEGDAIGRHDDDEAAVVWLLAA